MDVMKSRRNILLNEPHLESTSGAIASFNTDMTAPLKECKINFSPVQDLHGYDYPWPAGGGVNILDIDNVNLTSSTYGFMPSKDGSTIILSGTYTREDSNASFRITADDAIPYIADTRVKAFSLNTDATNHISQVRWTNTTGGLAIDLINLELNTTYDIRFKVCIYKGSTAPTVWTPYENVCPITGFDKVNVTHTGKNLFNTDIVTGAIGTNTGDFDNSKNNLRVRDKIKVPNGSKLTLSWSETGRNIFSFAYKDDGSFSRYLGLKMYSPAYFTLEDDECYFAFYQYNSTSELTGIQLEIGSTATDYRSYSGSNVDVEFPVLGKNICPIPKILKGGVTDEPWLYWGSSYTPLVNFLNTLNPGTYTISCKITVTAVPDSGVVATAIPYIRALVDETYYQITSYQPVNDNSPYEGKAYYKSASFTITDATAGNIKYCYFYADDATNHSGSDADIRGRFDISEIQIESGSTVTEYEPYTKTAYKGFVDLKNGNLTITSVSTKGVRYGLAQVFTSQNGDYYMRLIVDSDFVVSSYDDYQSNALACLPRATANYGKCMFMPMGITGETSHTFHVYIPSSLINYDENTETIIQAVTRDLPPTDFTFIAPLPEPIVYNLTSHQLKSLCETNNIWSDANGEIEVKYWTH